MSKLFGGKSPFDDPFFTEPFGGNKWLEDDEGSSRKQITIEELSPEDGGDHVQSNEEPSKELVVKNNGKKGKSERMQNFSFRRVAYGGINGTYYSCTEGRRVGDDGVVLVEMNEEDQTIGESLHTISKGVHNKGHSVTTKRSSTGQVDTLQTLHNMNEDELANFEETWKANADKQLPGWNEGFKSLENAAGASGSIWDDFAAWRKWGGWALPPAADYFGNLGLLEQGSEPQGHGSSQRTRRVVPVE
ncbi:uncharacterized protein LOC116015509 isoform X1 [Ipomoea triloba]|uniref:uncharacterized protein LOC116015509 isoform X1 n=1 Tax=Ipomoea triloba TaxID=35885 RepID=UPI00125D5909|nr:uncharacterized protein LOC116015509 isoform X1 [Ipomoea triloba]